MTADNYRRRNSLRRPHYYYTSTGAYFVTICAARRACIFGAVVNGQMQLNDLGQLAAAAWPALVDQHIHAGLDSYVVMPNHVHVLLWLRPPTLRQPHTPAPEQSFGHVTAGSLSALVRAYKSSVTQGAKAHHLLSASQLWQRNFYDNIVRNDAALAQIREYIRRNPERWQEDQLHPAAPPNPFNRA